MELSPAQRTALALIGLTGYAHGVHYRTRSEMPFNVYYEIKTEGGPGIFKLTDLGREEAAKSPLGKAGKYLLDLGYECGRNYGANRWNLQFKPGYVPFRKPDGSGSAFTGRSGTVYISRPQKDGGTYLAADFGAKHRKHLRVEAA